MQEFVVDPIFDRWHRDNGPNEKFG
jgi:hypothetical protein